ncbi:plastocyanin/azurin family copper-binding protein [Pseudoalteromonas tetraodonis]
MIGATDIIGGGKTTEVTFKTSGLTAGTDYTFFCSFPGHYAMMKGTFTLK